jgi:hypothetical protein
MCSCQDAGGVTAAVLTSSDIAALSSLLQVKKVLLLGSGGLSIGQVRSDSYRLSISDFCYCISKLCTTCHCKSACHMLHQVSLL